MDVIVEQFKFGLMFFTTYVLSGPFSGPTGSSEWAAHVRNRSSSVSDWLIYAIQFFWISERLAAGLGFFFLGIGDFTSSVYMTVFAFLIAGYILLDWYGWPRYYFGNYDGVVYYGAMFTYVLGWAALVTVWIIMAIIRAYDVAAVYYWLSFGFMALSSACSVVLAFLLVSAFRLKR